jgi:hypothetical protein
LGPRVRGDNFIKSDLGFRTSTDGQTDRLTELIYETFVDLGVEYIATTFNVNTRKTIHIITIYKPLALLFSTFILHFQKFLDLMPTFCHTIVIGDVNIDMLDQN